MLRLSDFFLWTLKYNQLRDELVFEARKAKSTIALPNPLVVEDLFNPEAGAQLWEDVGLDVMGFDDEPPPWMADEKMREAITATLLMDRAQEELQRLKLEVEVFALWVLNNLMALSTVQQHSKGGYRILRFG